MIKVGPLQSSEINVSTVADTVTFVMPFPPMLNSRIELMCVPAGAGRVAALWLFSIVAILLLAGRVDAQDPKVPSLGSPVPKQVITARTRGRQCLTDVNHHCRERA